MRGLMRTNQIRYDNRRDNQNHRNKGNADIPHDESGKSQSLALQLSRAFPYIRARNMSKDDCRNSRKYRKNRNRSNTADQTSDGLAVGLRGGVHSGNVRVA